LLLAQQESFGNAFRQLTIFFPKNSTAQTGIKARTRQDIWRFVQLQEERAFVLNAVHVVIIAIIHWSRHHRTRFAVVQVAAQTKVDSAVEPNCFPAEAFENALCGRWWWGSRRAASHKASCHAWR